MCLRCYRADVSAVLLCTSELLFYSCDSLSQLLDPCDADAHLCHIHNSCCCLLAALVIVGAPLESLYRSSHVTQTRTCFTSIYHLYLTDSLVLQIYLSD